MPTRRRASHSTATSSAAASQWLAPAPALKQAERRLQLTARALQLVDRQGRVLGELPGRFETLDHRTAGTGLMVATVDKKRQQALLASTISQSSWGAPRYLPKTRYAIEGLCLYRDSAANDFLFLVGEEGIGEQWLVAEHGQLLAEARQVRALSLPPQSAFCQADDASHSLYVNEENVGLWRATKLLQKHPGARAGGRPVVAPVPEAWPKLPPAWLWCLGA